MSLIIVIVSRENLEMPLKWGSFLIGSSENLVTHSDEVDDFVMYFFCHRCPLILVY